jgi:glyoxylase-like metal-dependent hydrolase (beta-lactamase superfamily II)
MLIQEKLTLEDCVEDVVGKAMRGLKVSVEEIAERGDLALGDVKAVREGRIDGEMLARGVLEKVGFVLNLRGRALRALAEGKWYPKPVAAMAGFRMFTTAFADMTVNSFLVWDPDTREAATFDTGSSSQPMLAVMAEEHLSLRRIFITHTHLDHLADLDTLLAHNGATGYGSAVENPLGLKGLSHGDGLVTGRLRIRVLGTAGHTPGGLSYFIEGLEKPLVVVGDALFAGSMGGAPMAYALALENNRKHLLSLPPETIVCPGHGPLTTVGEERVHNPFFPELNELNQH